MNDRSVRPDGDTDVHVFDTSALILLVTNSERLTYTARDVATRADSLRVVSAATSYEVTFKSRLGKLPLDPDGFRETLRAGGFVIRSVSDRVMAAAARLDWSNRDPWDRIIAATAHDERARIVSSDRVFDQLAGIERVW